ncbi:hypothetical protein K488DRAFT_75503 [Vararia minispora EC-137]|uniref:Uncharacterized protein n=1 Tax=Vararia minispora EC-137 TaxID=1314806 RepID=A0ACB8R0L9_9AGAM|nr:hypothetical protein K488DRAFT_75503 [Vararia minispora EC-137]
MVETDGAAWAVGPHEDSPGFRNDMKAADDAYTAPSLHRSSFSVPWTTSSLANATFYADYRSLDEIYSFMHQLAADHSDRISVVPLGHSGEGREMFALEINGVGGARSWSHDSYFGGRKREEGKFPPGFAITGAQHAREWIATSTALYIAHALVANDTEQYSLSPLLRTFNFYIVPVPNPDGYLYTWDHDRFWYKNRQLLGAQGYKWKANPAYFSSDGDLKPKKKRGAADPCSHWYPGSRPFQAPEVNNMANYFETLPHLRAYIDLRSYGQMLSAPYSYSCKKYPKDAEDQMEAISGAASAVRRTHGTVFTTGQLCSTLYRAPGNVVDWMYERLGVKWSFAAHLRDTGTYGFNLPAEWIRPVAEETTQMIDYLARFIATKEA